MNAFRRLIVICIANFLMCQWMIAQQQAKSPVVPQLVSFSGKATDAQGKTIAGTAGATFAIYKDQYEGSPLWIETQNVQPDTKGNYTVQLGATKPDGLPLDLFNSGEARWLGVTINGAQEQPRALLLSVPYALKAADAETLGGKPASAFMTAPVAGSSTAGSVPPAADQANEIVCLSTTGCVSGFVPLFSSNGGSAKVGDSLISQSGNTVTIGTNSTTTNVTVNGGIAASQGQIVGGQLYGLGTLGYGVYGSSSSSDAIYGYSTASLGAGVVGQLASGDPVYSYGVYGENDNTSGGKGVYGYTPHGNTGIGVQGYAPGTNAIGVAGSSNTFGSMAHTFIGNAPMGVIGDSVGNGIVATSDPGTAFVAVNNNSNYYSAYLENFGGGPVFAAQGTGGYVFTDANGNINVSGAVLATVKDFKIDHPLDPANKYLYHASVESAEMKNIYDGLAILDSNGSAMVSLPDWFEALNGDFRYQLTAIGAPAPNLHISEEIANHQFSIAGGQPGMKVSWQVTGVRHDAYAATHPLEVSVSKGADERGYYIHPELYGAPNEKGLAALHRERFLRRKAAQKTTGK